MPVLLPTTDLKSGMQLAQALLSGGKLLLPEGKTLTSADVDLLTRDFPHLMASVIDPLLDEAVEFEDDHEAREVADSARRKFLRTVRHARRRFQSEASLRRMDFREIEAAIIEITQFLNSNPVTFAFLSSENPSDTPVIDHAGNTFYLSMVLGNAVRNCVADANQQLRSYVGPQSRVAPPRLAPLGLAALLMDLSLWSVHGQLDKPGPLDEQQRALVFKHPHLSAQMIPDNASESTRTAVACHHENNNGTGYPAQLRGKEIPLFARILRIADSFAAATAERAHRPAKSSVRAFWEMTCGPYAAFYDPIVLKLFESTVQPYPIGARVRLACGRHAVVVRHGQVHGLLPEIVIAFDEDSKPLPKHMLDGPYRLDAHPELRIISFRDEDLTDIYGSEPITDVFDLPAPCDFRSFADSTFP
jgi:hypothetical protein